MRVIQGPFKGGPPPAAEEGEPVEGGLFTGLMAAVAVFCVVEFGLACYGAWALYERFWGG